MMIARRGERRSRESGRTVMMIGAVRRIIVMIARRHRISVTSRPGRKRHGSPGDRRRRSR
jgi:hypothetical protein